MSRFKMIGNVSARIWLTRYEIRSNCPIDSDNKKEHEERERAFNLEKNRIVAPPKKVISVCSTPPDTHTLHNEHALSKQK